MGITFTYELGLKSFLYEKHLLEKLHPNLTGGTLLNIFKIPKNLTEKSYGAFKIQREKIQKISNLLVAHCMLGAPLVTEKKLVSKKKLNYFSKYDT